MADLEYLLINRDTTIENFKKELRWNRAYYSSLG
jgi:L-arabinose isomerase